MPHLPGCNWVCATTARQRDLAKPVLTPEQAVAEMARRLGEGQRCGIMFGPERNGLETEEVANADAVVMAPVSSHFASLNLAQAVLLVSYEWMKQSGEGSIGRVTTYEEPLQPGPRTRGSPPASKEDLLAFFDHIERELEQNGFFTPAGEAAEHGAEHAHHVHPHGCNAPGDPHPARHRQGAGAAQARRPKPALVMPRFGPSHWVLGGGGTAGPSEPTTAPQKIRRDRGFRMTCRRAMDVRRGAFFGDDDGSSAGGARAGQAAE